MNNNRTALHIALCVAGISLALAMLATPAGREEQQAPIPAPESISTEAIAAVAEIMDSPTPNADSALTIPSHTHEEEFEPLDIALPAHLQEHAWNEAQRIRIDPEILLKLMWRESGYQIDAWCIDSNGYESVGLCQINGMVFDFLTERGVDWTTPEGNITAACELISYYRDERGYTTLESIAAYGAGETGMRAGEGMEAARRLLEGELPEL